jgi:hypothetical protein
MNQNSDFRRKTVGLGVFLGQESIAHIANLENAALTLVQGRVIEAKMKQFRIFAGKQVVYGVFRRKSEF